MTALGEMLSPRIHLGTSSWSFPGWTGLVYAARNGNPANEQTLARHGLAAYAAHPLFRTVSLDRTFYAPLTREEFARYAASVPAHFRFVVKAPAAITDPVVRKPGSGEAARDNPLFLDATTAAATFIRPAVDGLGSNAGPLVFQFPPLGRRLLSDVPKLAARIAAFMAVLPRGPLYAVEVRDPQLGPLESPCRPRLRGCEGRLLSVQPPDGGGPAKPRGARATGPCGGHGRPRRLHHGQQQGRGFRPAFRATAGGADTGVTSRKSVFLRGFQIGYSPRIPRPGLLQETS